MVPIARDFAIVKIKEREVNSASTILKSAMPKVYHAMKEGDDMKPLVDSSAKGLGVRGIPINLWNIDEA